MAIRKVRIKGLWPSVWLLRALGIDVRNREHKSIYSWIYTGIVVLIIMPGALYYQWKYYHKNMPRIFGGNLCIKDIFMILNITWIGKQLAVYAWLHWKFTVKKHPIIWAAFDRLPKHKPGAGVLITQILSLAIVMVLVASQCANEVLFYFDVAIDGGRRNITRFTSGMRAGRAELTVVYLQVMLAVLAVYTYYALVTGVILTLTDAAKSFHRKAAEQFRGNKGGILCEGAIKALCAEHMDISFAASALNKAIAYDLLVNMAFAIPTCVMALYSIIQNDGGDEFDIFGQSNRWLMLMLALVALGEQPMFIGAAWLNAELHAFEDTLIGLSPTNGANYAVEHIIQGHLMRIQDNRWAITCGNVVAITNSALFTILSLVVTYLTILLQFQIGDDC